VLLAALTPALAALAAVPWFVTQDGPAHLYNAEILARSLSANAERRSALSSAYQVRWEPLPNWAGHIVLLGLHAVAPPRWANLAINALTLVAFSGSVLWLRWRVAGTRGLPIAALLAALLGMNVAWLFGFTGFLLGAALFPLTLGVWWAGRKGLGIGRVGALAGLLVLGYFGHLVSLALTVIGLAVLATLTPVSDHHAGARREVRRAWAVRLAWTAAAGLPLVPLGLIYLRLSRRGGGMRPEWGHLANPASLGAWAAQLGWADPISLASRKVLPFHAGPARGAVLLAPAIWLLLALGLASAATLRTRDRDRDEGARHRHGWSLLGALLILGGLAAPDTLGASHGHYLPQRIVLLGLAALLPVLELDFRRWLVRSCALALLVALAVQSAFIWDYALDSGRNAGTFWRARGAVGTGRRVATRLTALRGRFRANALLHADCLLGLGTDNVIWSNYETRFYYFPVQFHPGLDRPNALELEEIALQDDPRDADVRYRRWEQLLQRHHAAIDVLVVWATDPRLDAIDARWFEPVAEDGPLRVLRHR
jgi:hypothetical protein